MVHASTKLFPFFTVYHREPIHPLMDTAADSAKLWPEATEVVEKMKIVFDIVKTNMAEAQARQKLNYDKKKKDMSYQVGVGERVLLNAKHVKTSRSSKKLDGKYLGPFKVNDKIDTHAYKLDLPASFGIQNVSHSSVLEPHHKEPNRRETPAAASSNRVRLRLP